jgi:hypothetical protein
VQSAPTTLPSEILNLDVYFISNLEGNKPGAAAKRFQSPCWFFSINQNAIWNEDIFLAEQNLSRLI